MSEAVEINEVTILRELGRQMPRPPEVLVPDGHHQLFSNRFLFRAQA